MLWASSQVLSNRGRFQVDIDQGCAPFTVNVTNLVGGGVNPGYSYEGETTTVPDTEHTYIAPGNYQIVQVINDFGGTETTDTLAITVYEPRLPEVDFAYCDERTVELFVTDEFYDSYEVVTDNQTIQVPSAPASVTLDLNPSVANVVQIEGFIANARQNCGVRMLSITPRQAIFGLQLNSFDVEYLCDDEIAIDLFVDAAPNTVYRVTYQNGSTSEIAYEGLIDTTAIRLPNLPLAAPQADVCLQIDALAPCTQTVIPGTRSCQTLPADFTAISEAYVSYSGEDIAVNFTNNNNGVLSIEKITEDIVVNSWDSLSASFIDRSISPIRQYDYFMSFVPSCGADTQVLQLRTPYIEKEYLSPNAFEVSWDEGMYQLPGQGVPELLIYSADDSTDAQVIRNPENPQIINLSQENGRFQVIQLRELISEQNIAILSNPLPIEYEYVVYVPKAFTPNDDGLNDRLEVFGLPAGEFEMLIYNKWGEVIHRATEPDDWWDGYTTKQLAPSGVYTYYIEFKNQAGTTISQRGSFILLKN
jgi:gliding motility-associated-like protein